MEKENRTYARSKIHARACLHKTGCIIMGEVQDLSMSGAFVTAATQMEVNDLVTITIYHPLTPQNLDGLKARVVRLTEFGMGLKFEKNLIC